MKKKLKELTNTTRSRSLAPRARLLAAALLLIIGVAANAQIPETGIHGTTVVLNDLEDHTWTYYAGVDPSVDDGNYNNNYEGLIYNPNPRNVSITYRGGGVEGASSVAVSGLSSEQQNCFVYYLTLEKNRIDMPGDYPYEIIPNPFSKRPAKDDGQGGKIYYGFGGWKIISGAEYILRENGSQAQNGQVLNLEEFIHFTNLGDDDGNDVMHDVVLEATWEEAEVIFGTTKPTFTNGYNSYEKNFWVVNGNVTSITGYHDMNCTITMMSPDGGATHDYRSSCKYSAALTLSTANTGTVKFEWLTAAWPSIDAAGRNLYIGRGINSTTNPSVYGTNQSVTFNQVLRMESGVYNNVTHANVNVSGVTKQVVSYGCDYDRSKDDNSKFTIKNTCTVSNSKNWGMTDYTKLLISIRSRSGKIMSDVSVGSAATGASYYCSPDAGGTNWHGGIRYLEIQGGEWCNIAGGLDSYHSPSDRAFTFRMRGGAIRGSIYGAAEYRPANGIRVFSITSGTIKGWVAAGANGTQATEGRTNGSSYMYIGGKARIDSNGNNSVINKSVGGNVYGAGCGNSATSQSGEMTLGTNVVVADNAYVEHGVYGGGAFGFTTQTANIYIAGNCTIDGKYDSQSGTFGGVYGGAKQNKGGNVNIYMTGGTVNGGINGTTHGSGVFGGSNASGVLTGNVNMKLLGGTIGSAANPANVHGGGYGASTEVTGNITVAIGEEPEGSDKTANKDEIEDLTIYGDVYGGSALGKTNTAASKTTAVNMYSGTVNGSVYGGALGSVSAAATIGATSQTVDIYGGKVTEAVYGGSNINASIPATTRQGVTVHATCTPGVGEYAIGSVFGGGNGETAASSGQPGAHDNHAEGTFVTVEDGYIGNVYGGGNNATVGKGNVTVNGGTFGSIFGGGNKANVVNTGNGDGSTTVSINSCSVTAEAVYGGCNAADMDGNANTTIWGGTIGTAFAGGNGAVSPANVGGNATLNIHGGEIGQAFAGSNTQGTITGDMNVFIDKQAREGASQCPELVGEVYGGGNFAAGKAGTITIDCTAEIGDLYGGANQADVTGDIVLNVTQGSINRVFGGNNTSGSINGSITVNIDKDNECDNFSVGYVYGGGNLAAYDANGGNYPVVNLLAGTVTNDVFGGGLGETAVVTGNPHVNVNGGTAGNVYGGGSQANVTGNTAVNLISGTVTGNIYGGGLGDNTAGSEVAANVSGTATVTIGGGSAANVFGCNNLYGAPQGTTTVNMTGGMVGNVYGGGNLAAYSGNPAVNISGGTVTEDVFGAGLGETATVSGSTEVNVSGATTVVGGNVYGGGSRGGVGGNTDVTLTGLQLASGDVFGGGLGVPSETVATVTGNTNVTFAGNTVVHEVYGGGSNGPVTGNTTVTIPSGEVKHDAFGGGLAAVVTGNTNVNVSGASTKVDNNVYGGGSAGNVDGVATVNVTDAKVLGNIYGAGYGEVTTTGSTNVSVAGQTMVGGSTEGTGNVYGGGELGDVENGTNVVVGDDNTQLTNVKNVYGAGKGAESDVKCTGANTSVNVTIKKSALVRGSVFGGSERGTVRSENLPTGSTGGHEANGKKVAAVTIESGRIMGNVYGGGELGATAGQTVVNMTGGTVEGNVFGGALGVQDQTFVYGLKTVNMTDGVVLGDIYGGSERANDTNEYAGEAEGDINSHSTVFVNVSGGNIAQNVYGGGFYGTISGNVTVNIGVDAINNGTDHARNTNKLELATADKKLLNIEGSIYAGSDWGEITVGGQFGPANISGYSNIYIDGAGYDMQAEMLNTSNYMNIAGSIYGAGTSSDAGSNGRRIFIRNYGLDQTATVDETLTYIDCTRKLYSIQRADDVYLEDTHITFIGQGDMSTTSTTKHYAILNVFHELRQVHNSTIDIEYPVENIFSWKSSTLPDSKTIFNAAVSDYQIVYYQSYTGGTNHLHNAVVTNDNNAHIDNKLRMNEGTYFYVRYPDTWTGGTGEIRYGEMSGFINMAVPLDYAFAFARPKVTKHEVPALNSSWEVQNATDGGFCSYKTEYNTFDEFGGNTAAPSGSTNPAVQHPYTNQLPTSRADSPYYRYWMIQGTNQISHREVVLVAQTDGDSDKKYLTATGTVTLNPLPKGGYVKVSQHWGDWGEDAVIVNATKITQHAGDDPTANDNWAYFVNGTQGHDEGTETGPVDTITETYHNYIAPELRKIDNAPNNTFGLSIHPLSQLTTIQRKTVPEENWNNPVPVGHDIILGNFTTVDLPFLSNHRFLATESTGDVTIEFNLTYNNQIDRNTVLSPLSISFEQYDANGTLLYKTEVSVTITTQTAINQDFDEPAYALMFGLGDKHEKYSVKATLPIFALEPGTIASTFKIKSVGPFVPNTNLEDPKIVKYSEFMGIETPFQNHVAVKFGPSLTYDNTLGWVEGYNLNNPEASLYDLMDITIPEGGFEIGKADGRQNIGLQFDLYYNGHAKFDSEDDVEIGRLPIVLTFDNVNGLTTEQSEIEITMIIVKRGHGSDWYVNGQHGLNHYDGHTPDRPKYSVLGVLFSGDYKAGDNIYITDKVVVSQNSQWPDGNDFKDVALYRYPGHHKLANEFIDQNGCYQGPLIEVEANLQLLNITIDGLNRLNDLPDDATFYDVNGMQYTIDGDTHPRPVINSYAPLVIVKNGGSLTLSNSSTLRDNRNDGNNNDFLGGAVWVQDGGTLNLKEGALITENLVIGNEAEGAGVYVNSERATVNVVETVTVTGNSKKATASATTESKSNIYLPTAGSVITIDKTTGLYTSSTIGITKTAFPMNPLDTSKEWDFTPIAYSVAQHQAEVAYGAHITDDGSVYSIYYDQHHDELSPNNIYFVKTWASEVREEPEGWDLAQIDSPEDLAWLISYVNGYNGQTPPTSSTDAELTANIDMDEHIWVPIGDATNNFHGTFDGNGYEISGLRSNLSGSDGLGLFGTVDGGTIKNTFVTNGTLKSIDSRYLGSIAGIVRNSTIDGCEGALSLQTIDRNTIMGGLVGLLDNSTLHSSIAVADLNGYRMGGLVGEAEGSVKVLNSYAYSKFADAKLLDEFGIIIPNNDLVAGLVADNASTGGTTTIDNCYVRLRAGNDHNSSETGISPLYAFDAASKSGNSISYCYYYKGDETTTYGEHIAATSSPSNIMRYDEAIHPYTYAKRYNYVLNDEGQQVDYLLDVLNKRARQITSDVCLPWFRTASDINDDYPLPKMGYDKTNGTHFLLAVSNDGTDEVLHFHHSIDEAFMRYTAPSGKDGANPVVAAYANAANATAATVNVAQPSGTELYINEDVAILQGSTTGELTAHVGITLDNSAGINGANPTFGNGIIDNMDWHMFSTPLANAPLGINYGGNNTAYNFWQGQEPTNPYQMDGTGYFPSDTPMGQIDFYCYFEPEYHWINFKRNGNSHWHQDNFNKIDYWYTDNEGAEQHGSSANNESQLIRGKGYLLSSQEETPLHTSGILNNGDVVYHDVTKMNNATFPALNLLGNPYQSYLDFDQFATANSGNGKIWSETSKAFYIILDEDKQGYVYYDYQQSPNPDVSASRYLHMHQGFFVVSEVAERTSATFTNAMRLATGTPVDFRGGAEKAAYPLINLILSEESGNKDYAVIELDRPKAGGAVKAKTVRAGAGQIYARYNDEDYAVAFTTPGLTSIPVRFNTSRDDVFTLSWTTLNADFSYLHLIDNITGADVDCLLSDEYVFYGSTYDLESRFKLVFQYTGVEENEAEHNGNFAFMSNGELIVNGEGRMELVDLQGRCLFATDLYGAQSRVALPQIASGLYLIRLVNGKQIKVQKTVIK